MQSIEWIEGKIRFLDQTRLPEEERFIETDDPLVVANAIKSLALRGAPLIGIAAAYGVALEAARPHTTDLHSHVIGTIAFLSSTRPTAVNLFWALGRMRTVVDRHKGESDSLLYDALLHEALMIHREDKEMCERIGRYGSGILPQAAKVLTHCNTGMLATGGNGTALAAIRTAWEQKKLRHVYITETRPLFQGARLTAWELKKFGIPHTLLTDSAAGFLMEQGKIDAVIVGADRIAANGDVANKVGTYQLAVLARHHGIPFYVAAPSSTMDFEIPDGKAIPVEQRGAEEVVVIGGRRIAPEQTDVYSPAFDVTPHSLVDAIVTEEGILKPPYLVSLCGLKHSNPVSQEGSAS